MYKRITFFFSFSVKEAFLSTTHLGKRKEEEEKREIRSSLGQWWSGGASYD
jgi:hypothetical protein